MNIYVCACVCVYVCVCVSSFIYTLDGLIGTQEYLINIGIVFLLFYLLLIKMGVMIKDT